MSPSSIARSGAAHAVVAHSASHLWSALSGLLCIYKPADLPMSALRRALARRICADANRAFGRQSRPRLPTIQMPVVKPHPKSGALIVVGLREQIDYSEHPLVVGEPFRVEDLRIEELHDSEPTTSGLVVLGLNDGCDLLPAIKQRCWIDGYRIDGELGKQTHEHEIRGKVTRQAEYGHVTQYRIQKLLSRIVATFQRAAFDYAEVNLDSQEAFEIAREGAPRAKIPDACLIYDLRLLDRFRAPHFSLEMQCTGATDQFLRAFVQEMALGLGTIATARRLHRYRIGPLRVEHALMMKHCSLQNLLDNMALCRSVLEETDTVSDNVVSRIAGDWRREITIADLVEVATDDVHEEGGGEKKGGEEDEDCLRIPWGRDY